MEKNEQKNEQTKRMTLEMEDSLLFTLFIKYHMKGRKGRSTDSSLPVVFLIIPLWRVIKKTTAVEEVV